MRDNQDIADDGRTFDVAMSAEDDRWRALLESKKGEAVTYEPNWNLLELLKFREFTNNARWTLSHEHLIHDGWSAEDWQCFVSRGIRDGVPHESLTRCRNLHFVLGRYAHFKVSLSVNNVKLLPKLATQLDDWPIFDVLHFLIPSRRIRDAVDNTITFWFEQPENYRIGLHRRAMKEGGSDASGSPYVCRYKSKSLGTSGRYGGLRERMQGVLGGLGADEATQKRVFALYDETCAVSMEGIQNILAFHKQPPLLQKTFWDQSIVEYKERGNQVERWFLACDGQEPEVLETFISEKGAITQNGRKLHDYWNGPLFWNRAQEMEDAQKGYAWAAERQYIKYLKLFGDEAALKREHEAWVSE